MNKIYIHYGSDEFDMNKFQEPKYDSEFGFKPDIGGLWASEDTDDESYHSWREWCEWEQFNLEDLNNYFRFKLADHQKPFVVSDKSIIETEYCDYVHPENIHALSRLHLNLDKLKRDGYTHIEFYENAWTHWAFYSWDCDCIFILDPTVIVPV